MPLRRSAKRIPLQSPALLKISGMDTIETRTINVSSSGIYFSSDKYIPVLSRVDITVELPWPDAPGGKAATRIVACEGVVVRIEPEDEQNDANEYNVACYFTSIDDRELKYLQALVEDTLRVPATREFSIIFDASVDEERMAGFLGELAEFYFELSGGDELVIRQGKIPVSSGVLI